MMSLISSLDTYILESLYTIRDPALVQIFIWISELGRVLVICGLTSCVAIVLIHRRKYAYAAGLCLSVATSITLLFLSKGFIERARPLFSYQAYPEVWYSFPSAHAAFSAALYFFLAYLAWKLIPSRPLRIAVVALLSLLVLAISFSRLYLGVHYASDVIAGVALGALCAWLGYRWVVFVQKS